MPSPRRGAPRPRRLSRLGVRAGLVAALIAAALLFVPNLLGLGTVTGFAQLAALRAATVLAALLAAAGATALGAALLRRRRQLRWASALLAGGVGLAVFAAAVGAAVAARGMGRTGATGAVARERLVVVDANVLLSNRSYGSVIAAARRAGADAIALQEAHRGQLERELAAVGLGAEFALSAPTGQDPDAPDTILAVRRGLHPRAVEGPLPTAAAGFATDAGTLFSIHTAAPVERAPVQRAWARTVRAAVGLCAAGTIVAGDFNASVDSAVLRERNGCADAGTRLRMGGLGSWPADLPAALGARIDHQLYDGRAFAAVSGELFDIAGSDHRGLAIVYDRRG
ncbi:endonuclease/exonuclease/phosphatase family protein [Brevibacterium sp. BRM-1]|nr:endonuclease/exonuclease/phosphatase family protein [Brevibacterium sp. BRM-1]WAL40758.1 endonuclease/exonuclease/phosphatase family protein [Brevibacterium sp. BRM-1]